MGWSRFLWDVFIVKVGKYTPYTCGSCPNQGYKWNVFKKLPKEYQVDSAKKKQFQKGPGCPSFDYT